MNRTCSTLLLLLLLAFFVLAQAPGVRCYVQLIRGLDDSHPPTPAAKHVGPRLSKCLTSIFRWKNYWEVDRQVAVLQPGKTTKLHLNDSRDLEFRLIPDRQIELRLLRNGALVRKSLFSAQSTGLEIMGGQQEDDHSWFVVVRQDTPQAPAN